MATLDEEGGVVDRWWLEVAITMQIEKIQVLGAEVINDQQTSLVYLDDIVVYSNTLEEHVEHLRIVFKILRENNLYVKKEKCSFARDEVHFLGHIIKDGTLCMDQGKVKAIKEWEPPNKVSELRSFLGLANYYRRFIKAYSAKAAPLTDLLKKNHSWEWSKECQKAFDELKAAITEGPILALPDY
nr:uncharacterized protein LOC112735435 [Arachis hypogaea]